MNFQGGVGITLSPSSAQNPAAGGRHGIASSAAPSSKPSHSAAVHGQRGERVQPECNLVHQPIQFRNDERERVVHSAD